MEIPLEFEMALQFLNYFWPLIKVIEIELELHLPEEQMNTIG